MPTIHAMDFDIFLKAAAAADGFLLDGDSVVVPPDPDYGYNSTPRNALTFAVVGCDGVHYAILTFDGKARHDSPVVQVSPMDPKDVLVLAPSFLKYLADGCGVSAERMV